MLLSHPAIPECVRTNNGYHERICKLARAATRRIYLETMSFDGYGAMAPVVDELINASQRVSMCGLHLIASHTLIRT